MSPGGLLRSEGEVGIDEEGSNVSDSVGEIREADRKRQAMKKEGAKNR